MDRLNDDGEETLNAIKEKSCEFNDDERKKVLCLMFKWNWK